MITQSIIDQLRQSIAKGETKEVILKLKEILSNSPQLNEILMQSARFSDLIKQIRLGLIGFEAAKVTKNQIQYGILELLSEIGIQEKGSPKIKKELEKAISISIIGSKNVVVGSTINAGGNVHIGDIINSEKRIPKYLTEIPSPEGVVIGRKAEIKNLYKSLNESKRAVLMNGMGGIGKTTIAMAYVQEYKTDYEHIAWIDQSGDFITALTVNTVLNKNLSFPSTKNPKADAKEILNKLSNLKGKSLLVIDNVNNEISSFKTHLPNAPTWQILMTSREELSFVKMIRLGFLTEENGVILFYEHFHLEKDDELVQLLLETIDYHTLTIELLAKLGQNLEISIAKIIHLLEERGLQIGRKVNIESPHKKDGKIEKIFPYLRAIFDLGEMEDPEIKLLKQFIGLPSQFFKKAKLLELLGIKEEEKTDEITLTLKRLSAKGWLIYEEQVKGKKRIPIYKMHKIIQDVLEKELAPSYEDLEDLLKEITEKLKIDYTKDDPVDKFPYVIYGERIKQVLKKPTKINYAEFQNNLATVYLSLGRYEEAADLLESALISDIGSFGDEHSTIVTRRSNLATVYQCLGMYEEAAELLEKALVLNIANVGEEHLHTAIIHSTLGMVYKDLCRYEEAAELLEKALSSNIVNLGENHPATATRRSNLAMIYKDDGRYEEAAELMENALNSDIINLGEKHSSIALKRSNLAVVYQKQKKFKEAAELLELSLNSYIINFGEEHPETARVRSNLANVYQELGKNDDAKKLFNQAYKTLYSLLGEDHPRTKEVKKNIDAIE